MICSIIYSELDNFVVWKIIKTFLHCIKNNTLHTMRLTKRDKCYILHLIIFTTIKFNFDICNILFYILNSGFDKTSLVVNIAKIGFNGNICVKILTLWKFWIKTHKKYDFLMRKPIKIR